MVISTNHGPGGNGVVGALALTPGKLDSAHLVLYGWNYLSSGNFILANGDTGVVRADNGFQVHSYVGKGTRTAPVSYNLALAGGGSVTLTFVGGLCV